MEPELANMCRGSKLSAAYFEGSKRFAHGNPELDKLIAIGTQLRKAAFVDAGDVLP